MLCCVKNAIFFSLELKKYSDSANCLLETRVETVEASCGYFPFSSSLSDLFYLSESVSNLQHVNDHHNIYSGAATSSHDSK